MKTATAVDNGGDDTRQRLRATENEWHEADESSERRDFVHGVIQPRQPAGSSPERIHFEKWIVGVPSEGDALNGGRGAKQEIIHRQRFGGQHALR